MAMFFEIFRRVACGGAVCALVSAAGCSPLSESTDETDPEEVESESDALVLAPTVAPDLAIQIRVLTPELTFGCLDAASASDAAAEIERKFRDEISASAFAEARCVTPTGTNLPATTIGVWSGGSTNINYSASLAQLNILENHAVFPAVVGTWVSRRFMKARVAAQSQDTSKFDVQSTDVLNLLDNYTGTEWTRTEVRGETLGTTIAWNVKVQWNEALVARSKSATHPGYPTATRCQAVPPAFTTSTNRVITSLAPNGQLEDGFPATGVIAGLVDGGLFPSRLAVKPQNPSQPLVGSVLHLDYAPSGVDLVYSGILDGLVTVSSSSFVLEDRLPCAKIHPVDVTLPAFTYYEASTFDLRPPLDYAWTASPNITVFNPTEDTALLVFADGAPGTLDLTVTDADGVSRTHRRILSRSSP